MKRVYSIDNLDCANCAAKMEEAIKKINGVKNAKINFMTQKLTLDTENDIIEELKNNIMKACKKIEPNAVIKF